MPSSVLVGYYQYILSFIKLNIKLQYTNLKSIVLLTINNYIVFKFKYSLFK